MSGAKAIGITVDGKLLVQPGTRRRAKKKPAKLRLPSHLGEADWKKRSAENRKTPFRCSLVAVQRGDVYASGNDPLIAFTIVCDVLGNRARVYICSATDALTMSNFKIHYEIDTSATTLARWYHRSGQTEARRVIRAFIRASPSLAAKEGMAPKKTHAAPKKARTT